MKAISVRGLSKEFTLGLRRPAYGTALHWLSLRGRNRVSQKTQRFLALNDISFEAEPGEVIGIIGSNGAGKSTLLKLLSRILRPTRGRLELRGRVGSLLEIGSGFHGELTGRENIFLNAAMLGMRHQEILGKLDEIVAFANIGQHLDQPVKHYSTGMYMRLAFAVAAHIEPEILLIDEVLAVGDADFQKKCIQRIEQVGRHGQTVLFVSHSVPAVLRLCTRALLFEKGQLIQDGRARDVAAAYSMLAGQPAQLFANGPYAPGDNVAKLRSVRVRSRGAETLSFIDTGSEFGIEMEFEVLAGEITLFPTLSVNNEWGELLWSTDVSTEYHARPRPAGWYRVIAWIPPGLLSPGPMTVTAALYSFWPYVQHFAETDVVSFQAMESDGGSRGNFLGHIGGVFRPRLEWTVEYDAPGHRHARSCLADSEMPA